jgi:germination protein M
MAKKRSSRKKTGSGRSRGLAALFWVCLAGIAIAVGFAAREPIAAAFTQITGRGSPAAQPPAPQVTVQPLPESGTGGAQTTPSAEQPAVQKEQPAAQTPQSSSQKPAAQSPSGTQTPAAQKPAAQTPSQPARKARLYFASVDAEGRILLKSVIRSIPASDSPLRDTLRSLLKGPTAQELNLGLVSMIPTEAALRGVTMRGDTAVVDFNEGFRFNAQGVDAMTMQLRQVVYAATEFSGVKSVQILIEGTSVRYLGPEGVRIDLPLSRASFPD